MPNTNRLINHEQGERIITELHNIANNYDKVVVIPSIVTTEFDYDGNVHTVTFNNLDANEVSIFGTTQASLPGNYIVDYQLKRIGSKWTDGTSEIKSEIWHIGEAPTWSNGSDSDIVQAVAKADAGEIDLHYDYGWSVGDERVVHLNALTAGDYNNAHAAQDVTLVIMDIGAYNGVGHMVVGFKNCLLEKEPMEDSDTNANGWHNSRGRKCCDSLFDMIPPSLQPIFKSFTVYTSTQGGSYNPGLTAQTGKLALFAEKELHGVTVYSPYSERDSENIHQIEYYSSTANKIKKYGDSGSDSGWWLRSPTAQYATAFCMGAADGRTGDFSGNGSDFLLGFAPFGVI